MALKKKRETFGALKNNFFQNIEEMVSGFKIGTVGNPEKFLENLLLLFLDYFSRLM